MGTDVQFTELKRSSMMNEKLPILCCLELFLHNTLLAALKKLEMSKI